MSPFNARLHTRWARPRTLTEAYEVHVGGLLDEPNWGAYEEAVAAVLRGDTDPMGHRSGCRAAGYPMGLHEVRNVVINGEPAGTCVYCNGRVA